jgi:hypothetical protein
MKGDVLASEFTEEKNTSLIDPALQLAPIYDANKKRMGFR